MRWRDLARKLEEQPGFRETYEQQFPYANVALAVVALRERHGLTQRDLAARVGTPQSVIARLESGRQPVEIKLLARIAIAVGETWSVGFDGAPPLPDETRDEDPGSGDALLDAFNEANTSSDFETAASIAARIAQDPSTPRRRLAIALDAYNRSDHAAAERWGREALSADDLPARSREVATLVVGRSILNQDRPKDALRVLRPLRKPRYIGWLRDAAVAEALLEAEQPDAAQAAVDRILRSVDVPEVHYLAARILWHRGNVWPALEHVIVFRAAQPEDRTGLLLHGSILGFLGDSGPNRAAHEAALALFERAKVGGNCEAVRLHGVTAARIGAWRLAFDDARTLQRDSDGHDVEYHLRAIEAIVRDVFAHLPDDTDWAEPTAEAEGILGRDDEFVMMQRALVAALDGDIKTVEDTLGVQHDSLDAAPVTHQLVVAAALIAAGRSPEATRILAANVDELSEPDGLLRLLGSALDADDTASAKVALQRLAEIQGSVGELASITDRLLDALARANESASVAGTLAGGISWSEVAPREAALRPSDSTWEGPHTPSSAVMDRMTRTFLH